VRSRVPANPQFVPSTIGSTSAGGRGGKVRLRTGYASPVTEDSSAWASSANAMTRRRETLDRLPLSRDHQARDRSPGSRATTRRGGRSRWRRASGGAPRSTPGSPVKVGVHSHERQDGDEKGERFDRASENEIEAGGSYEKPDHRSAPSPARARPGIARNLHDVVGSVLAASRFHLRRAQAPLVVKEPATVSRFSFCRMDSVDSDIKPKLNETGERRGAVGTLQGEALGRGAVREVGASQKRKAIGERPVTEGTTTPSRRRGSGSTGRSA